MKLTIACHLLLAVTGIAHAAAAPTTDAWEPAPFMEEVRVYHRHDVLSLVETKLIHII